MVLFRKCFEYFYYLLSSVIFLFLEEETPEIFPLFCLIQDCSDSVTSYPEYFSLKKKYLSCRLTLPKTLFSFLMENNTANFKDRFANL